DGIRDKLVTGVQTCALPICRYEQRLAKALAHVINLLDPDVIVLGGGMSNIDRFYVNVPAQWGRWVFAERVDTRLVRHRHGDSSRSEERRVGKECRRRYTQRK